tara:strand:- start:465 stop:1055 length:591 start_codon:yes stop_codon:yes gene_type:complete
MAQVANYTVDNDTGANVRADINNIFAAVQSLNSGSSDPSGTQVAFQLSVNTTSNLLKLRNASNNGYIEIGDVTLPNLGLAKLAGATFTGAVVHNYTTALKIPVGTTAQRPGSPATGELRFNSTLGSAEIYNGSSFTAVGGGAGATGGGSDEVFFESDTNVTTDYTITSGKNAHTVSPVINSGVTVTVPSGSLLVIL